MNILNPTRTAHAVLFVTVAAVTAGIAFAASQNQAPTTTGAATDWHTTARQQCRTATLYRYKALLPVQAFETDGGALVFLTEYHDNVKSLIERNAQLPNIPGPVHIFCRYNVDQGEVSDVTAVTDKGLEL